MINSRTNCRGCFSKDLACFLDLGDMPLAGGFLEEKQQTKEIKVSLKVYYCLNCGLVQILDVVDPEVLFQNYCYISSVIKSLSEHFDEYSDFLKKKYLKLEGSLLEFGCNDGVLLSRLHGQYRVFGVDPSENVSRIAKERGLKVFTDYFNVPFAEEFVSKNGPVDVVTGSNVFAHTDNIHEILNATKIVLKDDGVFIVEVHYLKDLIDKFQYDTIYHEHLCYYSVSALKKIYAIAGFKLIDVLHLDMHGGGIRVVAMKKNSKKRPFKSVRKFIEKEQVINIENLKKFERKCRNHKKKIIKLLTEIKKSNKSIIGYGAPGRGTIFLNYCGIDGKYLDYIVDVSPLRSGKLMPGVHIPIYFPDKARDNTPDYILVIAWNYWESIVKQEQKLLSKNVKFIIPFPQIKIK